MGKGSQTTSSSSSPPPQFLNAYTSLLGQANQTLATDPYQNYPGALVAGLQPAQTSAINEIGAAQGAANPYINSAAQEFGAMTTPLAPTVQPYVNSATGLYGGSAAAGTPSNFGSTIGAYESPYTQQVASTTEAQMANLNAQQANSLNGQAIAAGAFGGSGVGTAQAELAGQQASAEAPTLAGIEQTGYTTAAQTMAQQQQLQQSAAQGILGAGSTELGANEASDWLTSQAGFGLANLGSEAENEQLSGASALLGAGGLEQQIAQEQLNVPYEQFEAQQAAPYQELNWLGGLTEGLGGAAGGMSSTTEPGPSTGSQVAGGIMDAGALGLMGSSIYSDLALAAAARSGGRIGHRRGGGIFPTGGAVPTDMDYFDNITAQTGHGSGPPRPPPASSSNSGPSPNQFMQMATMLGRAGQNGNPLSGSGLSPQGFMPGDAGLAAQGFTPASATAAGLTPMRRGGILGYQRRQSGGGFTFTPGGNGIEIPQMTGAGGAGAPSAVSNLVPANLIGNYTAPIVSPTPPASSASPSAPGTNQYGAPTTQMAVYSQLGEPTQSIPYDRSTGDVPASWLQAHGFTGAGQTPTLTASQVEAELGASAPGGAYYGGNTGTAARGGGILRRDAGGSMDTPFLEPSGPDQEPWLPDSPVLAGGAARAMSRSAAAGNQPGVSSQPGPISASGGGPPPPPTPSSSGPGQGILPGGYDVDYNPHTSTYKPNRTQDAELAGASLLANMGAQAVSRRPNYGAAIASSLQGVEQQQRYEQQMKEKSDAQADTAAYRKADLTLQARKALDLANDTAAKLKQSATEHQDALDERRQMAEENLAERRSEAGERAADRAADRQQREADRAADLKARESEGTTQGYSRPDPNDPTKTETGTAFWPKYGGKPTYYPGVTPQAKQTGDTEARLTGDIRAEADALTKNYRQSYQDNPAKNPMPSNDDIWAEAERRVRGSYRAGSTMPPQLQQGASNLTPGQTVVDGFRYRGGNPNDRNSWEPAGGGGQP